MYTFLNVWFRLKAWVFCGRRVGVTFNVGVGVPIRAEGVEVTIVWPADTPAVAVTDLVIFLHLLLKKQAGEKVEVVALGNLPGGVRIAQRLRVLGPEPGLQGKPLAQLTIPVEVGRVDAFAVVEVVGPLRVQFQPLVIDVKLKVVIRHDPTRFDPCFQLMPRSQRTREIDLGRINSVSVGRIGVQKVPRLLVEGQIGKIIVEIRFSPVVDPGVVQVRMRG